MKTVIISYERISPVVLANRIERGFECLCVWRDINEDFFELSVFYCEDLDMLEDVLAEYV